MTPQEIGLDVLMSVQEFTGEAWVGGGLLQGQGHSVPPTLQQATADPRLPRRLPGKPGAVSCGVTAPFSWVLVHTRFCLCPPRACFPVLGKF